MEAARETRWARREGYDAVKMRLDPDDLPASAVRFTSIAAELPPGPRVVVEAVGVSDEQGVRDFVARIDRRRLLWVEDPVEPTQIEVLRRIVDGGIPVGAGESVWGVAGLRAHVEAARITVPIIDLGRVGGPTGLARFLEGLPHDTTVGLHLDARVSYRALALIGAATPTWIEVMPWWEDLGPDDLRQDLVRGGGW